VAPLRAEHARHAVRLRHRLEALAMKADAKEQAAETERRAAAQAVTDEKERAEKAREEEREARDAATKARGRLEELDNRRRWGITRGHLPDLTTPPAEHRDIVGGIRDGLTNRIAELAEQTAERKTQRESVQKQEKRLITDWNAADHELGAATAARRSLGERLDALCVSPRIRELAEASEGEPIILWSESPVILWRLSDAILAAPIRATSAKRAWGINPAALLAWPGSGDLTVPLGLPSLLPVLPPCGQMAGCDWQ
jgi:hypothetical protein